MAAIPDAGGARCAPRGVLRALPWAALLRVAVLGGLVIVGWLLGSGIGQAQEELAPQDLGQQDNIVQLAGFPLPDNDSQGPLGAAPTVKSAVKGVVHAVPVPRLPIQQVPVLAPVLAPVSTLAAQATVIRPHTQSQPTTKQVMVVPPPAAPAEPTVRAATVVTPAPVHTVHSASPAAAACIAAHPVADPLADQVADPSVAKFSALGNDPAAPAPVSPFGTTTAPCPSGSTGSGGAASSAQPVTMTDGVSGMDPASTYCMRCADLSGMPLAAAQRPSTSPD
ncbi:MAG: hypothetical protein M3332_18360 [Actinomycetota bacterium]|nr:hypothetical protein [Actinomycetota bacterium]HEX2263925.1 hypothetical protein [Pseudonocardiaceae bacterium]